MECWKWQRRHFSLRHPDFELEHYDDPFKALYDLVWKIGDENLDHKSFQVQMLMLDILESQLHQQQPQQTQKRYYQCRKGCGQEIYFDENNSKSQSGKWISLDKDAGQP